jgi:hypothetical protein
LRITLGTDVYQDHSFDCYGCGENIRIHLILDFENRVQFDQVPFFSAPTTDFKCAENCELCDEDLILNLDPNFLVPEELLHKENIFPWMYEAKRIGVINQAELPPPFSNDIITGLGGERDLKEKMVSIKKIL